MPDTPAPGSGTKPTTPFNIHEYVATFFFPDSMLDYFDIVWAEEKTITRKHDERYKTVSRCTSREMKSALDAIKSREDEVLNYFINHSTSCSD